MKEYGVRVQLLISYLFLALVVSCEKADLPQVSSLYPSSVDTCSALLRGNISSDGNSAILESGIEYSIDSDFTPGTGTVVKSKATHIGGFEVKIDELNYDTEYFYYAYATNSEGTNYGEKLSFTTSSIPPLVITTRAYTTERKFSGFEGYITCVVFVGKIISQGSKPLKKCGFNSGSGDNELPATTGIQFNGFPCYVGEFSSLTIYWSPGKTILYVAGASNYGSTGYGEVKSYQIPVIPPTVLTNSASGVGSNTVTLNGEVSHSGIAPVESRGIEYSIDPGFPQESTEKAQATLNSSIWSTGSFSVDITGLDPGVIYYYRAFAISDAGESKGEIKNFQTSIN